MAQIKSDQASADKWTRRTQNAGTEYAEGVQNPRSDWASQTKAAEANYEKGVQAAIQRKSFGKGVTKTGTSGWQAAALEKGPSRFAAGVAGATNKYAEGFKPYRETIKNLTLPPRGPKGDPANIQRVAAVAKALHDKKLALEGN
jgi:hypothetical protein